MANKVVGKDGIAFVEWVDHGKPGKAQLGALVGVDNWETITAWLKRWHPEAELTQVTFKEIHKPVS